MKAFLLNYILNFPPLFGTGQPSDFKINLERNAFKSGFYLAKIFNYTGSINLYFCWSKLNYFTQTNWLIHAFNHQSLFQHLCFGKKDCILIKIAKIIKNVLVRERTFLLSILNLFYSEQKFLFIVVLSSFTFLIS